MTNVRDFLGALALAVLTLLVTAPPADAAVGDQLKKLRLPPEIACQETGVGASLALVPGDLIGFPQFKVLVVTSCSEDATAAGSKAKFLYFLDPSKDPADLIRVIPTKFVPANGWGALALRNSTGDLIGCASRAATEQPAVYAIDIDSSNRIPDGTSTLLFTADSDTTSFCSGLGWDGSDRSVFHGLPLNRTIFHYDLTGARKGTFNGPTTFFDGLAIGGPSLFVGASPSETGRTSIYQLNKTTGAEFQSFATNAHLHDLECDPITFAAQGKDAIWSRGTGVFDSDETLFAFEIPRGSCGFAGGPPVVPAACPDGSTKDTDGDGLLDCWEKDGIDFDGDGKVDLQLYDVNGDGKIDDDEKADPNVKDIYLEVDWMEQHKPLPAALNALVQRFRNAPVDCDPAAPNNRKKCKGIRLHIQVDPKPALPHANEIAFERCTGPATGGMPDFDDIKRAQFGTEDERKPAAINRLNAKRFAFHYVLFAHKQKGSGSSGCAELPGNDVLVTLGGFNKVRGHNTGNRDQQAATLMHELGHNLNLRHGGGNDDNCKPNYLSIMSYTRQFTYVIGNRVIDYSRQLLPTLDETKLNEPLGIGPKVPKAIKTAYGPPMPTPPVVRGDRPIDWDQDGNTTNAAAMADVNKGVRDSCNGSGVQLAGYNDWANLQYDFKSSFGFADGDHLDIAQNEITFEEADAANADDDGDGVPNLEDDCPMVADPDQIDADGDGVGDACEASIDPCVIDSDGNGSPNAVLQDLDSDGDCELPSYLSVPGTLRLVSPGRYQLRGKTSITADSIVVDAGAVLEADPDNATSATLVARNGDIVSHGTIDVELGDNLALRASNAIDLEGDFRLAAHDTLSINGRHGVTIAPDAFDPDGPFTLLGGHRVDIKAQGVDGSIRLARARIASSSSINLITNVNISEPGPKSIVIEDRSFLTTDPHLTGLPAAGTILVDSTGPVTISDSTLDSGRTIVVRTRHQGDSLTLEDETRLEACLPIQNGLVNLSGVNQDGGIIDDGSTTIVGNLRTTDGTTILEACPR
jgi:hypothetical protein